ncbi:MAG: histidine kinase [Gammaproteobacteria bacterium]|nr:histidine kinase [Gammaproteobacteria bacterium]MCP5196087.1 histidine kinase [Gammaproteobacteria bacterium]
MRVWRLHTFLIFLLAVTLLVTLATVGSAILAVRLPQIAEENRRVAQSEAEDLVSRVEFLMHSLQTRLEPLNALPQELLPVQWHSLLDAVVGDGSSFTAIYILSPDGIVEATGEIAALHHQHTDLIGIDLSASQLYRLAQEQQRPTWSDRYLSVLSGNTTVGLAIPIRGDRMVIGEIPPQYLTRALRTARMFPNESIWIIDRRGELVGDTEPLTQVGIINLLGLPLVQMALRGEPLSETFQYQGRSYYLAAQHSRTLDWYFLVRLPAGLHNPDIQSTLIMAAVGFVGSLLIGILLAPLWASYMARPVRDLMKSARQVTEGQSEGIWPRSSIGEFNRLSAHLEHMANTIQEREQQLRTLNTELESRVTQRTADLAHINHELSETLATLRHTQQELVRTEKLAALGELVAGIAHELNTPIGNGLMAASTLHDKVREFQRATQEGLRRSVLDHFVTQVETAADITTRNLHRAAELVTSFKQVAVDQTSSQRRIFDLKAVVNEILLTLHPMLKRTPHRVMTEIPDGLQFDSYPGPLEQTLANLINNAILHAFDEGQPGVIQITANAIDEGQVRVQVSDNGKGIPIALQERIFNPFVTTKMGQGGTGLGLHIAHNIVTHVLGGSLILCSEEGQGSEFAMLLPKQAPGATGDTAKTDP